MCIFFVPKEQSSQPEGNKVHQESTLKKYLSFNNALGQHNWPPRNKTVPKQSESTHTHKISANDLAAAQVAESLWPVTAPSYDDLNQ